MRCSAGSPFDLGLPIVAAGGQGLVLFGSLRKGEPVPDIEVLKPN